MNHDAADAEPFFKYYKYITYLFIFKSLYYISNLYDILKYIYHIEVTQYVKSMANLWGS